MLFPCFFFSFGLLAYAQTRSSLGNFPLAVKTPYLHAWIPENTDRNAPQHAWPRLFTQEHNLGWNGMIRVDDQPYQWLGDHPEPSVANFSTTVASEITPTSTIFTIQAGLIKFKATFFTPIEPNDYTRQSIPFTYLFVDGFVADDGNPHKIQLYSDVSGEWISHDTTTEMEWGTQDSRENMVYHHLEPRDLKSMTDSADSAEDATVYYATPKRPGLTWQTGADTVCRAGFAKNGSLTNAKDIHVRPVNSNWPVFSFAIDLGLITPSAQPEPVVWALGLVRDPLVNYATEPGSFQLRTGYYWSAYHSIDDVISDFLGDFANTRDRGQAFDGGILQEASAISSEYAGILSLVTRQIFASMDITIAADEKGRTSPSDVKIFMKDISVSNRANPVEVIYAALPALLYFNPSLAHDLLLPLFEFQSSPFYPKSYASSDLGSGYPNISGNIDDTEDYAIEHCGNMLIMAYAHAAKSGDGSLIFRYHSLLQKWADYLVPTSLHPLNTAKSADDISYPGMSNLALKGVLGVHFMGKIDEVVSSSSYTTLKANELFEDWKQSAVIDTHIKAEYGKPDTWGLTYNLFPAIWLQTGLVDDFLNREAQFYHAHAPPGNQSYSLLDDDMARDVAYPHWALTTAAIIPSGFTPTIPLPKRYTASTGDAITEMTVGSAIHGAAFAILAMRLKNVDIRPSNTGANVNAEKKTPIGSIVGGVIGGLALLLVIAGATLFWRRRQVQQHKGVVGLRDEGNHNLQPFIIPSYTPVNNSDNASGPRKQNLDASRRRSIFRGPFSKTSSDPLRTGKLHLNDSERNNHSQAADNVAAVSPPQSLSNREREIIRQNRSSTAGSVREVALRAEMDELRREVEAIRHIAQPPPSYE
ncbi:hypothetical protein Agabi119p4_1432 [Agaricus bisporus var. burnettii]|uniref:Glutaminase A n=1 Tax=Agaricus bisporus var. burnettii TaxID=192524 RepID=A0A8H7F9T5_AGABI|nr:hypothetical protein Agabi119p4_1432 [Agaricus bisporus var. burnettii]